MGRFKIWVAKNFFKDIFHQPVRTNLEDASSSGSRESIFGLIKKIGLRFGDLTNTGDFEEQEFDLESIKNGCEVDAYLRQGVDKYVDQIFKEGYEFYGADENAVAYVKSRLDYMSEATDVPLGIFLQEIAEDVVKYANCIVAKSRSNDPNMFPQGATVTGLNGKDAVAGYFLINPTTVKVKRDKNGKIKGYKQEIDDSSVKLNPEDVVHLYYKRERGNAFGTPFLLPVLNDVRALREAEDNVLKMMYRNIYPFLHVKVGDDNKPGTTIEIDTAKDTFDNMEVDGGLVTSNRININAVDTNKVINAEPYLRYMEDRIFSGMGIPPVLFGRGGTANRSTGDNMSSEMSDRIRAMQNTIETFINFKIIKELLMEGGYDPIINPDQEVKFMFVDNDIDCMIKQENHAIFKYEHNSITEDEMRDLLGKEPITDRSKMFQALVTQANAAFEASIAPKPSNSQSNQQGTKSTNNKNKPTNQHGTKTNPKKTTNSVDIMYNISNSYKDTIYKKINNNADYTEVQDSLKDYLKDMSSSINKDDILNTSEQYSHRINDELVKFGLMFEKEIAYATNKTELFNILEVLLDSLCENINFIREKESE